MRRGRMLRSGPDGTTLFVCTTCRCPGRIDGTGEALVAALVTVATEPAYAGVAVEPVACLWSCGQGVSAQLRAADRIGYVMGGFVATDARALLDFAVAYGATTDGVVPYKAWPAGILGHFIARTPPAGMTLG